MFESILGISCYSDSIDYIEPFFIVSVQIDSNYKSIVKNRLSDIIDIPIDNINFNTISKVLSPYSYRYDYKDYSFKDKVRINFYKIGRYELEKYTIQNILNIIFKQYSIFNYNKVTLVHSTIKLQSNQYYVYCDDCHRSIELSLSMIISKYLRLIYLKRIPYKLKGIANLKYLPYNYIHNNLIYKLINNEISIERKDNPEWLVKYIESNYERLIK